MRTSNVIRLLACMAAGSAWLSAGPLSVLSYDMLNGEAHTFSYMDKTYNGSGSPTVGLSPLSGGKGLLTDGGTGVTDFTADLGHGAAYEWVGWALTGANFSPPDTNDTFATMTFKLSSAADINSISLFINNFSTLTSGVGIFNTATVSFSNDDVTFVNPIIYTTTAAQRADSTARFITIPLNQVNPYQYVQVHLTHTSNWVFLSEVTFDGTAPGSSPTTPEPSSLLLSALGVFGLGWKLRRR